MYLRQLRKKSTKSPDSGEITIYLSLVFSIIISLLLTVVTAARGAVTQVAFECAVENSLCSVFGEYNRELFDEYGLMYIDLSYLSNSPDIRNLEMHLNDYYRASLYPEEGTSMLFSSDFVDVKGINADVEQYLLATDNLGESFIKQSVEYMKNYMGLEDAQEILNKISVCESYNFNSEELEKKKEDSLLIISNSEEDNWSQTQIKKSLSELLSIDSADIKIPGNKAISMECINPLDTLLIRNKHKGNVTEYEDYYIGPIDNVIFSEYIMKNLGCFTKEKEDSKLKYEVEYVIKGYCSDYLNSEKVLNDIYCIRILADYISIRNAEDKVEIVKGIATIIAALIEVPEELVTEVLVLIWACAEGVVDVKEIADGKEVSLIKQSSEIKVSIEGLVGIAIESSGDNSSPDQSTGTTSIKMDYEDYLRLFLYIMAPKVKAYRVMDMIEQDIRNKSSENKYFRFDACTDYVVVSFTMESGYDYRFLTEKKYTYY